MIYARSIEVFSIGLLPRSAESDARYKNPDNDQHGPWTSDNMTVKSYSANYDYPIRTPNGTIYYPPAGRCWFTSKERMQKLIENGAVWFGNNGGNMPRIKRYLSDVQQGMTPITIWKYLDVGHNQEARQELKKLFDEKAYFDGPKPIRLLNRILTIANVKKDDFILDFFSGSGTTAHAVMQLNAEDGGKRKFIMVQLQEECAENSEAYKAGYKNICEIGKERIRRAGQKIKEENPLTTQNLDIGFRVLKCDSSNMEDVYFTPKDYMDKQQSLFVDNIKKDRSDEDLLFDAMLKLDTPLSSKIEKINIAGKTVYNVAQGHLMACFDKDVTDEVITAIAKEMPSYFVMRDSSQADDSVAINFEQIFNTYSPQTVRRVL